MTSKFGKMSSELSRTIHANNMPINVENQVVITINYQMCKIAVAVRLPLQ